MIFLETLYNLTGSEMDPATGELLAGLFAVFAVAMLFVLIIGIAIWIYSSFAFMAIAKKNKQSSPGIAWIPGIGPLIVAYRASGMHFWPWLLLAGYFVLIFLAMIPYIGLLFGVLAFIAILTFVVFTFIWGWKMFEAIGKPGWWALTVIVPFIGTLAYLILIGIAAWSKD